MSSKVYKSQGYFPHVFHAFKWQKISIINFLCKRIVESNPGVMSAERRLRNENEVEKCRKVEAQSSSSNSV